ncbi:hypothetical protein E4P29_06735 [Rhodococcus sp. 1R11]|uniref:hypothetical protein n=1 Tax=Rhodococcus sp. 1R11 TaxID=2559614 RepID=UPI001071D443|nr:hypothetical protein [Rhodococcus sp. 1R11]TFI44459.1 hypothetical protein E4P29_06735 [Rhodococcus sp. 1R11]
MPATPDGSATLRGCAVGALTASITAAAHAFGGGMFPSDAAIVLLALVCAGLGYTAAVVPILLAPRLQLTATLAAAQTLGHVLLTTVDGDHHGSVLTQQMLAAHAIAIVVGAVIVHGAERGISRAATVVRRVLPMPAVLVVDDSRLAPPLPVYRAPGAHRLLDLSGSGNRGPPVPSY